MRSLLRAAALLLLGATPGPPPCLGAAGAAAQGAAVSLAQAHAGYFPIGAAISPEADLSSPAKKAFDAITAAARK